MGVEPTISEPQSGALTTWRHLPWTKLILSRERLYKYRDLWSFVLIFAYRGQVHRVSIAKFIVFCENNQQNCVLSHLITGSKLPCFRFRSNKIFSYAKKAMLFHHARQQLIGLRPHRGHLGKLLISWSIHDLENTWRHLPCP